MKLQNLIHILIGIVCIGLLPTAQAVVPPPDGGYPGGNTAEGQNALLSLTNGANNTAVGWFSLRAVTDGQLNTAIGAATLFANTGNLNTATGAAALFSNTIGLNNTASGSLALFHNTIGNYNTANGFQALFNNTTGGANTANGDSALNSNTFGSFNTAIGRRALSSSINGSYNTALGYAAGSSITGDGNVCIGANVFGVAGENRTTRIRNIYTTVQPTVGIDPDYVTVDSDGRLGRANISSRRYKHDIKPIDKASEALFALKPVSFRYNKQYDATQTLAYGLIAEDVAEVYPDLVGRNPEGQPESVRYEQINAMLLNEFLNQHRKVEEQQATITQLKSDAAKQEATISQLKKGMEVFAATLEQQAAQIQKVSAQLEASKATLQVVLNNQ